MPQQQGLPVGAAVIVPLSPVRAGFCGQWAEAAQLLCWGFAALPTLLGAVQSFGEARVGNKPSSAQHPGG